jgi:hypothetical protein
MPGRLLEYFDLLVVNDPQTAGHCGLVFKTEPSLLSASFYNIRVECLLF